MLKKIRDQVSYKIEVLYYFHGYFSFLLFNLFKGLKSLKLSRWVTVKLVKYTLLFWGRKCKERRH